MHIVLDLEGCDFGHCNDHVWVASIALELGMGVTYCPRDLELCFNVKLYSLPKVFQGGPSQVRCAALDGGPVVADALTARRFGTVVRRSG